MSDEGHSDSSSDGEDLRTTGLIATRAKRSTAGNLYATLRQNLDDEELQKELLAEEEEDAGDYEGSDKDGDDDEAMDSSSDEDDAGPAKEGEAEDLEGERELKKAERADARKKRKLEQAKLRLPAWQKKKRVKLADDVKTEDGAIERPKKKSERSNWMPTGADAPVRQSERAHAVANREITHAHLKQSAARSEKQRRVMKDAAKRERANKRADLTQDERLAKTAKIEKETSREFGRWEREEAERQRIREEQLAAKRSRGIDGPIMRHWSGSVLWEGDKLKIKRLHGSQLVDEIQDEPEVKLVDDADTSVLVSSTAPDNTDPKLDSENLAVRPSTSAASDQLPMKSSEAPNDHNVPAVAPPVVVHPDTQPQSQVQPLVASQRPPVPEEQIQPQMTWLAGIHEYAAQPIDGPSTVAELVAEPAPSPVQLLYMPSAPAIHGPVRAPSSPPPWPQPLAIQQQQQPSSVTVPGQSQSAHIQASDPSSFAHSGPQTYHGWPPGSQQFPVQQPQIPLPFIHAPPLVREQAQRTLVMLEQFEKLEAPVTSKRGSGRSGKDAVLEPNALASTLFPASYPTFSPEESRYLTAKMRKRGPEHVLPAAPVKTRCAVTSWPAKFRDPKTGLPYAELQTYKMIQRLLAGGCAWSGFLGAWVGPTYGPMGRPAKGVPEGFAAPPMPKPIQLTEDIKSEEAS